MHLNDVLSNSSTDNIAVVKQWFLSFLRPRFTAVHAIYDEARVAADKTLSVHQRKAEPAQEQNHTSTSHSATDEMEPEPEPEPQMDIEEKPPRSHTLSTWQARGAVVDWLERQATHGRSKLLVPELLSLEEQLYKWSEDDTKEWVRPFWQLVQHLRWGVGAFWAPQYDINPKIARATLAANLCSNGPLYLSEANTKLGAHRMCLPMRVAVSPTIHRLMGHGSVVTSVQFSPDGLKLASGSRDTTES